MKKQITFLFALIMLAGCSVDEQNRQDEPNCNCDTIIQANVFAIPTYTWTVVTVKNDCTGAQRQIELSGRRQVGEKICD